MKLNDTIIEFGNWKIEYETSSWSGSFDINGTKLKEVVGALASCEDKQPEAEFDEGKFKFSGKIILEMRWKMLCCIIYIIIIFIKQFIIKSIKISYTPIIIL